MRFQRFIATFIIPIVITFTSGLVGCTAHSQNYSLQNQWLANNYPDRAAHLDQTTATQPYFRDAVIAGQIQLGMTVDEVLIATDTMPFGPKRYKGKFWCNNKVVRHCDVNCELCDGIIFLKDRIVWFNGQFQHPTVVYIDYPLHQESIFLTAPEEKFP